VYENMTQDFLQLIFLRQHKYCLRHYLSELPPPSRYSNQPHIAKLASKQVKECCAGSKKAKQSDY